MPVLVSISSIDTTPLQLIIQWSDGRVYKFPFIFLRDNCPCCRHVNGQKLIETAGLDVSVSPQSVFAGVEKKSLTVVWQPDGHKSEYSFEWLQQHSLNSADVEARKGKKREENKPVLWDASINGGLPESDYAACIKDDVALGEWLGLVKQYGFGILRNVPAEPGMVLKVVGLFGYVRETNYGKLFDVKTVVNPNNLAYTGLGISPHTDNPYRNPVPTLQLLHCLGSTANGGDSILVDGFKVADDLCKHHPQYFTLLASQPVTFSFSDKDNWLERTVPIIELAVSGQVAAINFNNRSIQPFEINDALMVGFYEAYVGFARMLEHKQYQAQFKMGSGDLYMVNNRRILHARSAYSNTNGERWLQGAYADVDGLMSKWRVLNESVPSL